MSKYVYRWETPEGNGPMYRENSKGEYRYVFVTMKSAIMWLAELGWGYDNPGHSDLILCMYKADECYPVCDDIGSPDEPREGMSNGISGWCSEFIARVWDRTPISYMTYEEIKSYGKMLSKAYNKSMKAVVELLQLESREQLREDNVCFYSYHGSYWKRWSNDGDRHELVSK